jgi:hypothetical protein
VVVGTEVVVVGTVVIGSDVVVVDTVLPGDAAAPLVLGTFAEVIVKRVVVGLRTWTAAPPALTGVAWLDAASSTPADVSALEVV